MNDNPTIEELAEEVRIATDVRDTLVSTFDFNDEEGEIDDVSDRESN
jgi:hypothetical protein